MKKALIRTLGWTAILFVLLAMFRYFTGDEEWLMNTLEWVVPSATGYFLGCCNMMNDKNS